MISNNNLVIMLVTGLCLVVIAAGIHTKYIYDTHQDIDETQESWESKSLTNTGRIRLGVTWLVVLLLLLGMASLYYVFRKVEGENDGFKNDGFDNYRYRKHSDTDDEKPFDEYAEHKPNAHLDDQ